MKQMRLFYMLAALIFLCFGSNAAELPLFSNGAEEHWYLMTFNTSNKFIRDNGDGQTMTAVDRVDDDGAMLWKLVGTTESFTLVSKSGGYVNRSDMFKTYTAIGKAHSFKLVDSNFENCWMVFFPGDEYGCMNNYGNGIGGWKQDANDPNNAIRFMSPDEEPEGPEELPGQPKFSDKDSEHWYVISYANGGRVFTDNGDGKALTHVTAVAGDESQMWKLVGTPDAFQLVSKAGRYVYKDGPFRASSNEAKAITLKLEKAGNPSFAGCLQINYTGDGWGLMNQYSDGEINGYYNDPTDQNNALTFLDPSSISVRPDMSSIKEFDVKGIAGFVPGNRATLWYDMPATAMDVENRWMEYALPIGNGEFGGMVYGGVHCEQVQFNDKSLWTGTSKVRGCYQNFGDIFIEDISGVFDNVSVKDYVRYLDLYESVAGVSYSDGSTTYSRRYIASNPDKAVVIKLSASERGKISVRVRLLNNIKTALVSPVYSGGEATFEGKLDLVDFKALLKVIPTGGDMLTNSDNIEVTNADEVLLILAGGTDFDQHATGYISSLAELKDDVAGRVERAASKGWDDILSSHVADYQSFFNRVDLILDKNAVNDTPTDRLIDMYPTLSADDSKALLLEELYFNYGRYLLISSSRGMDSPANLQGIWNNSDNPAWQSDIHSNINVQMNYWPAENTNLSEMHMPYLNYIHSMAVEHEQWQEYARRSGQTKGWTCFTQNNIFGHSDYAENYVIANAWYTSHLWQHYLYTLDLEFLKEKAFPVMKSCCEFWLERLVEDPDGSLVAPDEWSPEHGPSKENGTAHAQQIVADLFSSTLQAIGRLGYGQTENAFATELAEKYRRLDKGLAIERYTGAWGSSLNGIDTGADILREWKYSDYSAGQNGHRHQSHLMAMYPFSQINPASEYFTPAVNSLKLRSDESTGWSLAWKVNLWARALDGDHAHSIIRNALRHSTSYAIKEKQGGVYYNLFDSHAPFQIDGNLGYAAGVAELLLQSYDNRIMLLPALPEVWKDGHADGLRAIGNFEVDQEWADGVLHRAVISSFSGMDCSVSYNNIGSASVTDSDGNKVSFVSDGTDTISFPTVSGKSYTVITPEGASGTDAVLGNDRLHLNVDDGLVSVNADDAVISVYDLLGNTLMTAGGSSVSVRGLKDMIVIIKAVTSSGVVVAKYSL